MIKISLIMLAILFIASCSSKVENYPGPNDFVECEKFPYVDINKFQKLIKYPIELRKANIQGRVIVKILVDKNGKIVKKIVEYTENELLNESALDAFDKYGKVEPAIQNGKPIHCWVSVPIKYKL